jgi:spermidine synthase
LALIWQKRVAGNCYQVRSHGASVRLYSNGVFHSQWNPRDPLKGSLWELLLLPAFFLPAGQIRSVLVLGVGGGAVIRLLQEFIRPQSVVGVDLDPRHLFVARKYFGVRGVELICADAREFVALQSRSGKKFSYDLIIDDLFGHAHGEAARTVAADEHWCADLLQLLCEDGLLVANFASRRELLSSAWRHGKFRQLNGWSAELPGYENCIAAFSRNPLPISNLTGHIPSQLNPGNPARRLDCRLRRLK